MMIKNRVQILNIMTPGIGILNNAVAILYLRHHIEDLITPHYLSRQY